jgi:hypothetical protein
MDRSRSECVATAGGVVARAGDALFSSSMLIDTLNTEFKGPTGSATTTVSPPRSFARLRQREPWPAPSTNSEWQAMLIDATRGP